MVKAVVEIDTDSLDQDYFAGSLDDETLAHLDGLGRDEWFAALHDRDPELFSALAFS